MKLLKVFSLSIIYFIGQPFLIHAQKGEGVFYNDTIIEFAGCSFEFKNSLSKESLFKTELNINNLTNKFLRIGPGDILLIESGNKKIPAYFEDEIVVAPHYSRKIRLKFDVTDGWKSYFSFLITKMEVADKVEAVYSSITIPAKKGESIKTGPINLEMVYADRRPEGYAVKVKLYYEGNNLLGVNYGNIALSTDIGNYFNERKQFGKFHFNNSKNRETLLFIFPVTKYFSEPATLVLDNVFTEYKLSETEGFTMPFTLNFEGGKDEGDIELIE